MSLVGLGRGAMRGLGEPREGEVRTIHRRTREATFSRAQTDKCIVNKFSEIFGHLHQCAENNYSNVGGICPLAQQVVKKGN